MKMLELPSSVGTLDLIPLPADVRLLGGSVVLPRVARLVAEVEAPNAVRVLRERFAPGGGFAIHLRAAADDLGDEGYALTVAADGITIDASAAAGWFYGVQTLLQLGEDVPCVRIVDRPRFGWRGLMFDTCRHFFGIDDICRLLDAMALHKLNTFHWHLTDDQGWRIESRHYPRLHEIGAVRRGADGKLTPSRATEELPHEGVYGGFYTHDDVRRVVAHAASLHIRVVPEVEMPGHALAALAAYPEFACEPRAFEPATRMGIFKDVYCAGNDAALAMLEGVLDEIVPLFPGEFVHVGGDECPKDRWKACPKCQARIRAEGLKDEHELQSYVIRRMSRFLAARGKRLIGWDEILEGGLPKGATVMSWRGTEGGIAAARAGHDVVMTPHRHCYLDYRQAEHGEPASIPDGLAPLEKTLAFDPVPADLTADQARHVLGVQGNCWTEYMHDIAHVEYMVWPRAAAIAEIGWSPAGPRDDFRRRAIANERRLVARGIHFRPIG